MSPNFSWFPWNGSKRWLLPELAPIFRSVPSFYQYHDPFVGGGSVSHLVRTLYPDAVQIISDANPWLIAAYQQQMKQNFDYDIDEIVSKIQWYRDRIDNDLLSLTNSECAMRFAICLLTAWGNRWETLKNGQFRSTINPKFFVKNHI